MPQRRKTENKPSARTEFENQQSVSLNAHREHGLKPEHIRCGSLKGKIEVPLNDSHHTIIFVKPGHNVERATRNYKWLIDPVSQMGKYHRNEKGKSPIRDTKQFFGLNPD